MWPQNKKYQVADKRRGAKRRYLHLESSVTSMESTGRIAGMTRMSSVLRVTRMAALVCWSEKSPYERLGIHLNHSNRIPNFRRYLYVVV